jgi:mono/diheme cytochrome c family protein
MANDTNEKRGLLGRLFIDMMNTEQRALLGTLFFFITIIIVGWIAIQEPTRLGTFLDQYEGRAISRGAVLFRENCVECHGVDGRGIPGKGPGLTYESFWDGTRLQEVGWAGSQYDFVYLTVAAGRPVVHPNYDGAMPTWGQEYGGPMRPDQVRDVTAYVMNYQLDPLPDEQVFLPYDLNEVSEPAEPVEAGDQALQDAIAVAALEGDVSNGEDLFSGAAAPEGGGVLGCQGCHSLDGTDGTGPSVLGIPERFPYEDYDVPEGVADAEGVDALHYYMTESIWYPSVYGSPNYDANLMPQNFRELLTEQELADLIAYILEDVNGE